MRIAEAKVIGYDCETTGLIYPVDRAFGFSVALPDGQKEYWDIRKEPRRVDWFNDEMSRFKGLVVCHNAPFDYRMSHIVGIRLPIDRLDDTATRACQINEKEHEYSLDHLCKKYLDKQKVDIWGELASLFGGKPTRNAQILNLVKAPVELVAKYAIEDPAITLELWQWQEEEIERQGIRQICDFERTITPSIIRATMRGIRVNCDYAEQAMAKLEIEVENTHTELVKLLGHEINVNSPPQIKKVFKPTMIGSIWVADNGTQLETTESGNASIDSPTLRSMEGDRRAELIVLERSLIKTKDTFLGGHVLGHAHNGRVYPNINQNKGEDGGTGSGRLSITEPAMQQIPSRNQRIAGIVKPVFLPEEGQIWVDADEHSFEVRVFAHLVNDPFINEEYRKNPTSDFHKMVAALTGLPRDATYSGQANAKQLNLSMIFNSGNGAIADKMGMPWEWHSFESKEVDPKTGKRKVITYKKAGDEAMEVIDLYHQKLPGVKALAEKAKAIAETRGYIKTYNGRRFRFPRGFKSYKASGLAIQMTAADINKKNWTLIEEALGGDGNLLLNTHDSYSMSIREDWQEPWKRVKESVENSFPWFRVPLILELSGTGPNWWEAVRKDKKAKK